MNLFDASSVSVAERGLCYVRLVGREVLVEKDSRVFGELRPSGSFDFAVYKVRKLLRSG